MASQPVEKVAMYSVSAVLIAILDCFLLNHEIIADPDKNKHPPDVLLLFEILLAQSASVIAILSVIMFFIIV